MSGRVQDTCYGFKAEGYFGQNGIDRAYFVDLGLFLWLGAWRTRRGHSAVKITRHCGIAAPGPVSSVYRPYYCYALCDLKMSRTMSFTQHCGIAAAGSSVSFTTRLPYYAV
jgi:hypothetical protein